jgi:hypothetical protein
MKEIVNKILNVTNSQLDSLNTDFVNNYNFYHDISYFHLPSGREHYRLLTYISTLFVKQILCDIGTNKCMSAAALSSSMKNRVKTYDIQKCILIYPFLPYVEYIIGDATKDPNLINYPFIFLDANHDGLYENILYNHLKTINWKGILLLDDIHLGDENGPMKTFWNNITEEKYDITKIGHWSGSGLCLFK